MIDYFFTIIVFPALLIWFLTSLGHEKSVKKPMLFDSDGLMHAKLGAGQVFVVAILLISLIAISERVLYDLSRTIGGPNFSYIDDLRTIMAHALFVVPVFVVLILMNIFAGEYKKKYAIILMPYFITTIVLAIQLVIEISIYFANHHTKLELYVVLLALAAISSWAIWYVQQLYAAKLAEMKAQASHIAQSEKPANE